VPDCIHERRPELGAQAESLFRSMCAFDPAARTSDLAEIKKEIERLL
jgi:hypothetical protein